MKVDVAIIGAGPAGGMAALQLAGTGLTVVVLEKARIPRSKACGGAMSWATYEEMRPYVAPAVAAKAHRVRFYHNYAEPAIERPFEKPVILVNRAQFDQQLITAALDKGSGSVILRDGWPVKQIKETGNGLRVIGPREEKIQAGFLIGADGPHSLVARCLGLHHRAAAGFAIDASVEATEEAMKRFRSTVQFNYNCVPGGYGWIFPKGDRLSCGIGSWRKPFPTRRELNDFLQRSLPGGSIRSFQMRAHPVPLWTGYRRIASKQACLAGDAASLVHPVTGEGIRFALTSGRLAAETILSQTKIDPSRSGNREPCGCKTYEERIHRRIGQQFEILQALALPVFLEAPDLFFRKFIREGLDFTATYGNLAQRIATGTDDPKSTRQ